MTVSLDPRGMVIDGQSVQGRSESTFDSINPSTEEVVAVLSMADEGDVDRAVAAARRALEGEWSRTSTRDRQRLIMRLAHLVQDNAEELASLDSQEMGIPLSRSRMIVASSIALFEWYAAAARTIRGHTIENSRPTELISYTLREPVGVVGAITPWNTPLPMMIWKLGPVLATGSTLVHKPAEITSLSALRMAELALEAGIPAGVVNVITGDGKTGAALAAHRGVDKVAFTGSVATGQAIMRAAAGNLKRVSLELGGKSPNIVFADADLDLAAAGAAHTVFGNTGQICVSGSRLLVQREIYDEFLERVVEKARAIKIGDPLAAETEMGPVASEAQLDRVLAHIDRARADGLDLLTGGGRPDRDKGFYVEPTIFSNVSDDAYLAQNEVFGPVLAARPFDDLEEAARAANATEYGLSSYVWTRDIGRANEMVRRIRSGTVQVNTVAGLDPAVPVGGVGISGFGKELGLEQLDEYLETKTVWVAR